MTYRNKDARFAVVDSWLNTKFNSTRTPDTSHVIHLGELFMFGRRVRKWTVINEDEQSSGYVHAADGFGYK